MSTRKDLSRLLDDALGPLTFGRFLRGARAAQDTTQAEMARQLGISRTTLCDIEKGRQIVSPQLAARIARTCGLSEVLAVETALTDLLRRAGLDMHVHVQAEPPRPRRTARVARKTRAASAVAARRKQVPRPRPARES